MSPCRCMGLKKLLYVRVLREDKDNDREYNKI